MFHAPRFLDFISFAFVMAFKLKTGEWFSCSLSFVVLNHHFTQIPIQIYWVIKTATLFHHSVSSNVQPSYRSVIFALTSIHIGWYVRKDLLTLEEKTLNCFQVLKILQNSTKMITIFHFSCINIVLSSLIIIIVFHSHVSNTLHTWIFSSLIRF